MLALPGLICYPSLTMENNASNNNNSEDQPGKLSLRTKLVMGFAVLFLLTFMIGGASFLACRGVKNAIENPRPNASSQPSAR